MKRKGLIITILSVAAIAGAIVLMNRATTEPSRQVVNSQPTPQQPRTNERVPAHFEDVKSIGQLAPTLSPDRFIGPAHDAYKIAQEIPQTLAQLPCYCHCDMNMGHKSIHSCFEDTHASECAVCVSEALVAYDLQRSGMKPAQIRDRIIQVYSHQ